jgi:glycosyltransferase involved in cell wall biosynthesis
MTHVLIFEPHASGHRAVFVRYLLESMERHGGIQVTWAVLKEDKDHPQVQEPAIQFAQMLHIAEIGFPDAGRGLLGMLHPLLDKQFRYIRALRRFVDAHDAGTFDYVFVPFIDDYGLAPLAFSKRPFAGLPWGGIVVSPRFHSGVLGYAPRRLIDGVERALYAFLLSPGGDLHEVFTIDPYFQKFYSNPRLRYVPDPAARELEAQIQSLEGVDVSETDAAILVYGNLDHRKGIPDLLRAMADPRIPEQAKLLLVGVQHESVRSLLDQPFPRMLRAKGRLIELNRVVSDAEETAAFHTAKIVWVYYPGSYGPSGVLVRAGHASKPVICTRQGYCGRIVAETGMGITVDDGNTEGIAQALVTLLADQRMCQSMGRSGFEYFSQSSPAAFADPIVSAIAERTSSAKAPAITES